MLQSEFVEVLDDLIDKMRSVLDSKSKEYSTHDKLHNFKVAAGLKGETPRQALMGMLVKHTVSVYDMGTSTDTFTMAQWDEKIIDHLNYLVLLKAIIVEEKGEPSR
jgi:hypothetical protein